MIRLIAIDLDGTLLGSDHSISEENRSAIQRAQKAGIEVIITTGRNYKDAQIPIKSAKLNLSFSCLNGGEVRDKSGNILYSKYINNVDLIEVVNIHEREGVAFDLFIGDYLYTRNVENQILMYLNFYEASKEDYNQIKKEMKNRVENGLIIEVDSYANLLYECGHAVYKVLGISAEKDKLLKVKKQLKTLSGLTISSSGIGNIEITDFKATKGISLEYYAKREKIPMREVMVIGDNYNDLSMMEQAGLPIAMGNAPNEVKKRCISTTTSNDNNGVAVAINKLLNNISSER